MKVYVLIHKWLNDDGVDIEDWGCEVVAVAYNIKDLAEQYQATVNKMKEIWDHSIWCSEEKDNEFWLRGRYGDSEAHLRIEEHEILGGYPIADGMKLL